MRLETAAADTTVLGAVALVLEPVREVPAAATTAAFISSSTSYVVAVTCAQAHAMTLRYDATHRF